MTTVKNLRRDSKSVIGDSVDEHESYGMISLSRQQCGGEGFSLFGSAVHHHTAIRLTISKAERMRDAYTDHYFSKDQLIEIRLSPAQFTGMISNFNTSGIPCTLRWLSGKGYLEQPPTHHIKEEMLDDITEEYAKLRKLARELEVKVESIMVGVVKKADKEEIRTLAIHVNNAVNSNLEFLQKRQKDRLERAVSEAKVEVEAAVTGIIHSAGLDAIAKNLDVVLLPEETIIAVPHDEQE